jgi:hypothetical protein
MQQFAKRRLTPFVFFVGLCLLVSPARSAILDANYTPNDQAGLFASNFPVLVAQTFTVENTGTLTGISLTLDLLFFTPPNQPLLVDVRTTELVGTLVAPTTPNVGSNILSTATLSGFTSTTPQLVSFDMPDFAVTAGQHLAIVLRTDANLPYSWQVDFGPPNFTGALMRVDWDFNELVPTILLGSPSTEAKPISHSRLLLRFPAPSPALACPDCC